MAGAKTPEEQTVETLEHAIRQAGRTPAQRDSYYNHLSGPKAIRPRAKLGTNLSALEVRGSPRLGCVSYLNARPLIYGWPGDVHFDHPSVLCELLAASIFDVALVSSFEYLRNPVYSDR